jgi:Zn-dependent M28 family amino/carboxypeptidase
MRFFSSNVRDCVFAVALGGVLLAGAHLPMYRNEVAAHADKEPMMDDPQHSRVRLRAHVRTLTKTIGERSVSVPGNLDRTAAYLQSCFEEIGIPVHLESYRYGSLTVSNVVAEMKGRGDSPAHYILGAHYDSVAGTVGADDNASAVAVMLETARVLAEGDSPEVSVTFIGFALEEPPVFGTRFMGSRVYAAAACRDRVRIDGMVCLEMVGYTCHEPGCQHYPFPLRFFGYPKTGDFIGIVGNFGSRDFARHLERSFQRNRQLPVVSLKVPFNGRIIPSVRLSDHASFWDQGFPAVMVTDSAFFRNPHYHRGSDTMETLDFDFMSRLVQSLVGFFCDRSHFNPFT